MIDSTIRGLLNGVNSLYEWTGLEKVASMIDGGGADTGGVNKLAHGKATWKPGDGTNPALLSFAPAKRPAGQFWDNAYMYNTISRTPAQFTFMCWEMQFALGQNDLSGNAREFEIELCESGWTYNMAWQYKWSNVDGPPAWRLFDQVAVKNKWVTIPSIPITPKADAFIDVQAFFQIDRVNGITIHDSITVDGVNYPVNLAHKKLQKWSPQTNYLHNAVQIDSIGDGKPCAIQIKNWNVRGF